MEYRHVVLTTTTDSADEARVLADAAVGARLAACAHVGAVDSVYWWEGAVQRSGEFKVDFKTRAELADELTAFVLARHSYDTPQVTVTPLVGGSAAYLAWIDAETTTQPQPNPRPQPNPQP